MGSLVASLLSRKTHTQYERQGVNTWFMWEQSQRPRFVFPQRPRLPFAPSSMHGLSCVYIHFLPCLKIFSYRILVIKYFCHVLKATKPLLLYIFHYTGGDLLIHGERK